MKTEEREFIPVLLGNDINTYSLARAFYEAYGVKSVVLCKSAKGPSAHSRIIDLYVDENMDTKDIFVQRMRHLSVEHANKKILVLGCGDNYVEQIISNKALLAENVVAPYISEDLMQRLITKKEFYRMCDEQGLDYPQTFIYTPAMEQDYRLPFEFPVILKPSSGINYWQHEFEGQKKVYRLKSLEALNEVIGQIYASGYEDDLVIQDFIPGDDSYMRVMTCFSGQDQKIQLMSMGHVLLEEHTPHGLGNTSLIFNDYNEELSQKIKGFLEHIGYVGLANFDIKYDQRDGKYKIFEINVRQGRNNFYVTGAGDNLARYVVEEFIYHRGSEFKIANAQNLWIVIPRWVAFHYVTDPGHLEKMKQLVDAGKVVNPLFMKGDLGFIRLLYLCKSHLSHFRNYKKYYPVDATSQSIPSPL